MGLSLLLIWNIKVNLEAFSATKFNEMFSGSRHPCQYSISKVHLCNKIIQTASRNSTAVLAHHVNTRGCHMLVKLWSKFHIFGCSSLGVQ